MLNDSATEIRAVISFIIDVRRFRSGNLPEEILKRINQLDAKIAGSSLQQQLDRYVLNSTWSEEIDEEIPEEESIKRRVAKLANRSISEAENFRSLITKLVRVEGLKLYQFGFEIGNRDKRREFLPDILSAQRSSKMEGTTQFIGGYLYSVREASESEWEKLIIELLFDNEFKEIAGQLIWRTGINNNVLKHMLKAYSQGTIKARDFITIKYSQDKKNIDQILVEEVLSVLIASSKEDILFTALEIAADKDVMRNIPKELVFELLTKPDFFRDQLDTMKGYHWGELARRYLDTYPERDLELFTIIMSNLRNGHFMTLKSTSSFHSIAEQIAKGKPTETWEIIQNLLGSLNTDLAYGLLNWLEEERDFDEEHGIRPLTYFPAGMVLAWVNADPDNRAPAIASVVPKTFNKEGDGCITRELLHRYGHLDRVKSAIFSNFNTEGWSGRASEHYRKRRDQARSWLNGETSPRVTEWLDLKQARFKKPCLPP